MGWPYGVPSLTHEEKLLRRETIDLYACIAHYSAFAPALLFLLYRLARRVPGLGGAARAREYEQVPGSPVAKASRLASSGSLARQWQKLAWWLRDDVFFRSVHWGQRDQWLLGLAWTTWLLALCVLDTGTDYFHLTKRFGAIAVSQFPIQYLLAIKPLNPYAWAFGSSHEEVNRYHRVLGRVIFVLLALHILFYNGYFFYAGIWLKRFFAPIVFCGVVAAAGILAIATTSTVAARQYSYRLFFITHLVAALFIPVLIFFHAPGLRLYIVETLVIFLVDLGVRRVTTIKAPSTLQIMSGTALVKVTSRIPRHKLASFQASPGLHIYLSVPPESRTADTPASQSGVFDYLYNPFTVAFNDEDDGSITLIARTREGPMTGVLSAFADAAATPGPTTETRTISLGIEGPYGSMAKHFDHLLHWGAARVLVIAGGVGATFAVPVFQALRSELPSAKVQLVWAVRSAGDAAWAVAAASADKTLLNDDSVQLYLTGGAGSDADGSQAGAVEMEPLRRAGGRLAAHSRRKRPDLGRIIDQAFSHGLEEPVAVLVCGPTEMTLEVRRRVRPWAMKGRRVWWHGESFGW
ncbi:hypothetical protein JDV02_003980 [Purpureocillium takamizusanense]|uniref:FAD-binding FR-type domain-containing protein n=1 Tax=Purpureocillium takamizusanense TaxID=2060973 RepID=A0A9Q8QE91_9HYPO|nr:uncharacterized protein JDV02_003980 [Purpureocillium takamizusanense]UNI17652.1 hypothetical protein JDV02_003980 [Purpureocillium takamizusanense]